MVAGFAKCGLDLGFATFNGLNYYSRTDERRDARIRAAPRGLSL